MTETSLLNQSTKSERREKSLGEILVCVSKYPKRNKRGSVVERDQCHGARAPPATCLSKAFSREPLVWRKKWRASGGGAQAGSPGGQEACHLACRVCPPEQSRSLAGACLALSTAS